MRFRSKAGCQRDRAVLDDVGAGGSGDETEAAALAPLPLLVLPTAAADAAAQDGRRESPGSRSSRSTASPKTRRAVSASRWWSRVRARPSQLPRPRPSAVPARVHAGASLGVDSGSMVRERLPFVDADRDGDGWAALGDPTRRAIVAPGRAATRGRRTGRRAAGQPAGGVAALKVLKDAGLVDRAGGRDPADLPAQPGRRRRAARPARHVLEPGAGRLRRPSIERRLRRRSEP